jgi:uncharacterized coiled-coil protein SlyX
LLVVIVILEKGLYCGSLNTEIHMHSLPSEIEDLAPAHVCSLLALPGVNIMGESEIARLRRLIELECAAMEQGLTGYSITARHDIIAHKYDQLDTYQKQLEQLIGKTQAKKTMAEIYIYTVG